MNTSIVRPHTYGRMGNFLFQAAAAIGYATKHGLEFTVPDTTKNAKANPIYLQHLVNPRYDRGTETVDIIELGHEYKELPFREELRNGHNIHLDGYWQTEKYFSHCREEILKQFAFPWHPMTGFVSIHVRRGDYLVLKHKHPYIGEDWIKKAMFKFPGYHFIFFSDDLAWCKLKFSKYRNVSFSEGTNEVTDLKSMSWCEHHICSASTFSWWGAWLNRNPAKRIVIPKNWFMPGHGGLNTSDIVPEGWEKL